MKSTGYWFSRNGIIAVEACRIALALVYIIINFRSPLISAQALRRSYPFDSYSPDGVLMLLGKNVPPDALIDLMISLSIIFPWLLLFGVFSRISLLGTLVSHLFLRTLIESFTPEWSHGYNVVLLAHLGFLFAPVGQTWSIDAVVKRFRGKETKLRNGYWAIITGQWCVALMFASAFYWKALFNDKPPFAWAHWENMRNLLFLRYEWTGDPIPDHITPLMDSPFVLGLMAWTNLLFQFLPFLSLFFLHKPWLRLVFGLGFVVEELGLGLIMGLPDLHWLPLIAFFVDWDHFFGKKGIPVMETTGEPWKRTYAVSLVSIYLIFSLNISGSWFGWNVYDLRAYPFSKFNMYAGYYRNRDGTPYCISGTTFRVQGAIDEQSRITLERKLKRRFYDHHSASSEEVRSVLDMAMELLEDGSLANVTPSSVERITLYHTIHEFRTDTDHVANGMSGSRGSVNRTGTTLYTIIAEPYGGDSLVIIPQLAGNNLRVLQVQQVDHSGKLHPISHRSDGARVFIPKCEMQELRYLFLLVEENATTGITENILINDHEVRDL